MRIAVILLFSTLVGCGGGHAPSDTLEIYSATFSAVAPETTNPVVVREKVRFGDPPAPGVEELSELGRFTFNDPHGSFLPSDLPWTDVILISEQELQKLNSGSCEEFWEIFRSTYPREAGLFKMSDIGFSEDGSKAILYIQGQGGCTIGQGSLVVLIKDADEWVVDSATIIWVS